MINNPNPLHPVHPACEICKGACCETVLFPRCNHDANYDYWVSLRAVATTANGNHLCPCRCTRLSRGRCTIYDARPAQCDNYAVGGEACRATVKAMRPEIAQEIEERF